MTFCISSGCGWSQTLKTFALLITPKPAAVACKLLRAYLMSPSAVKIRASKPLWSYSKASESTIVLSLFIISESASFVNLTIAHLDYIGSISFELSLHAKANLVVFEYSVITILKACWALSVMLSASSRIMSLCIPGGTVTFWWANYLILSLTTSIPLSSEALSSKVPAFTQSPSIWRAIHMTLEVFPVPGGPTKIRFGIFPNLTIDLS